METPIAQVTIVITARERFSLAVAALEHLIRNTRSPYELIYVDGNAPLPISEQLSALCHRKGFTYIRKEKYMYPPQARNLVLDQITTPYVVFMENDVLVEAGWLETLLETAREHPEAVLSPLICQRRPLHQEIHMAGVQMGDDVEELLQGKGQVIDAHLWHERKVDAFPGGVQPIQSAEFHCVWMPTRLIRDFGGFDSKILAGPDHMDFSLRCHQTRTPIYLQPDARVTFLFPDRNDPLQESDQDFFLVRWAPRVLRESYAVFAEKWHLEKDPYLLRKQRDCHQRIYHGMRRVVAEQEWMRYLPLPKGTLRHWMLKYVLPMKAGRLVRQVL
jgi:hypothetical protein